MKFAIERLDNVTGEKTLVNASVDDDPPSVQAFDTAGAAEEAAAEFREVAAALEWNCTYTVVPYNEESASA